VESPRETDTLKKKVLLTLVVAVASLSVLILIVPLAVKQFTFMPRALDRKRAQPSYWGLSRGTMLELQSGGDAKLVAWWVPQGSEHPLACGTVLILNGNMGNITDRARTAAALSGRGLDVMLFDYRGYGASTGQPTEAGIDEDAVAAYDQALARTPGGAGKIVLFAHSLGAVPAVALAARKPVGGIILIAAYASAKHAVVSRSTLLKPFAWRIPDSVYAPARRAGQIKAPVLVISGGRDGYVSRETTDSLYESFSHRRLRVYAPMATHNSLMSDTTVWRNVDAFLARVLPC
jgi:fermentation-respiration switch protein FrsA (DUF1100 family)